MVTVFLLFLQKGSLCLKWNRDPVQGKLEPVQEFKPDSSAKPRVKKHAVYKHDSVTSATQKRVPALTICARQLLSGLYCQQVMEALRMLKT